MHDRGAPLVGRRRVGQHRHRQLHGGQTDRKRQTNRVESIGQRRRHDQVADACARQPVALRQRPQDEQVVERIRQSERVEVVVSRRGGELQVDLVDDDDCLEAVGDPCDLVQRHRIARRVVGRAQPDEARGRALGGGADLVRGLRRRGVRARHRDDVRAGQGGLHREHREGRRRDDDRVARAGDSGRDEPDQLVGAGAGNHPFRRNARVRGQCRAQTPVAEVAVLDHRSGVPRAPCLANRREGPVAEGVHVVAHDRLDRQPGGVGQLLVRGLQRISGDRPGKPQQPRRVRAHCSTAAGQRSTNDACGRRSSSWTDPPIACIEAWTR